MKFLVLAVLHTLVLTLTPGSAFLFAQREAPDMVIYYVNEQAANTTCSANELTYIDSKMLPDVDMTLFAYNYLTPAWEVNTYGYGSRRELAVSNPNCDFCKQLYPKKLCNAMYNCKNRRQLHTADGAEEEDEERELVDYSGLVADIQGDCQDNLARLFYSWWLSRTCRTAIRSAVCHVEIVV